MSKRRRERYSHEAATMHIRRHHPNCPPDLCAEFAATITSRQWEKATLGKAFGIVATNYVRHKMTDYDLLKFKHGLTRDEARLVVANEVRDILASWKAPTGESVRAGAQRDALPGSG